MFVQHSNIYLMIASRQNCNAASLLFFLHRVVDVSILSDSVFAALIVFPDSMNRNNKYDTDHLRVSFYGW